MGLKVTGGFCRACRAKVMAQAAAPSHLLHLVLSLLTAGLWLPIWLLLSATSGAFRCTHCGSKVSRI